MKISVRVKAGSSRNGIKRIDGTTYHVSVTAPPVEGRANEMVIELLSEYFGKPKRCIAILKGQTSKIKIIEID